MSASLWGAVEHCGVYIPASRWNTDHRMVELDLGEDSDVGTKIPVMGEERQKEQPSAEIMERKKQKRFNQYVLRCKLDLDPDQQLQRLSELLEQMVAKGTEEMILTQGAEEGPNNWATGHNAEKWLQILNGAVTSTIEKEFPDGVPANNQQRGRN